MLSLSRSKGACSGTLHTMSVNELTANSVFNRLQIRALYLVPYGLRRGFVQPSNVLDILRKKLFL